MMDQSGGGRRWVSAMSNAASGRTVASVLLFMLKETPFFWKCYSG